MILKFREPKLSKKNLVRVEQIKTIILDYTEQGYKLTLRQLYYQLVSRDLIPNQQSEYAKLSNILKEMRMGGLLDWNSIEDRLRVPSSALFFENIKQAAHTILHHFKLDRLEGQKNYIEVWVEKDALSNVMKRAVEPYQIPVLVNRGYSSVSAMYDAYNRFSEQIKKGKKITILYTGDHDPSGMDMVRDIKDRILEMLYNVDLCDWWCEAYQDIQSFKFMDEEYQYELMQEFGDWLLMKFEIVNIALTDEQIDKYQPPPNPTKLQDPRAETYIAKYGMTCWEVDALDISVLYDIVLENIKRRLDLDLFNQRLEEEKEQKRIFTEIIEENF